MAPDEPAPTGPTGRRGSVDADTRIPDRPYMVIDLAGTDRLLDHLDQLRRRLTALGDDLADGLADLAWAGRARDRFERHLGADLADLSAVVQALARARHRLDAERDHAHVTEPG